ncbi:hypothetical protein RRSWK_05425 [Rhodopirellula sp. SWK7]|nr:hypothetical protein RRSWK_05425 [Rhodopirellula sp. SWK7]
MIVAANLGFATWWRSSRRHEFAMVITRARCCRRIDFAVSLISLGIPFHRGLRLARELFCTGSTDRVPVSVSFNPYCNT